ncbi:cysteine-rich CWC family protein [Melaminivora sp.]|uniref:cysteine-rich CWC family protein n=1 Tax=Melaminivora sp. TaxID=1933032 RepID=UPI0028AF5EEA|nr:cysteine-rich CWC family protein [Melaminivora sp.]
MSALPASTVDPARCPLCGQSNTCAIPAGQAAQRCWCMSAPVSSLALARVAPELRGQACLCPRCAQEGAAAPAADKMAAAPAPPSLSP